jgi:hypothetical protein
MHTDALTHARPPARPPARARAHTQSTQTPRPHPTFLLEDQGARAEEHAESVTPLVPVSVNVDDELVPEDLARVHLPSPPPTPYCGLKRQSLLIGKHGPLMQRSGRNSEKSVP